MGQLNEIITPPPPGKKTVASRVAENDPAEIEVFASIHAGIIKH